jgi:hypothetical protein
MKNPVAQETAGTIAPIETIESRMARTNPYSNKPRHELQAQAWNGGYKDDSFESLELPRTAALLKAHREGKAARKEDDASTMKRIGRPPGSGKPAGERKSRMLHCRVTPAQEMAYRAWGGDNKLREELDKVVRRLEREARSK